MTELNNLLFELSGGWPAVIGSLIMKALGYFCIGFFLHLGWKLL